MKITCRTISLYFIVIFILLTTGCHFNQPKLTKLAPGETVLAFGDSLTYGTGATTDTSYPHDLAQITGLNVINAGVPGEETNESLNRITTVLDETKPRLVIVCLGGNDLLRRRSLTQLKENLKTIIQTIQQHGAQVMLIAVPEPNLTLQVPELYEQLGDELNIPVETNIIRELMRQREYKSDTVHFNAAGYHIMAQTIAKFLQKQGAV